MFDLWKVDVGGFQGINLHPREPFGDHFVYSTTEEVARELGIFVCQDWGGASGTKTVIKKTTTVEQARELRRRVHAKVEARQKHYREVKNALEGIEKAIETLEEVKEALEG